MSETFCGGPGHEECCEVLRETIAQLREEVADARGQALGALDAAVAEMAERAVAAQGPYDCADKCDVRGLCKACFANLGEAPSLRRKLAALAAKEQGQ